VHNSPFYDMIYSLREKKKKSVSTDKQCIVMRFFWGGDWLIRCKLSDEVEEYLLCSSQSHKKGKATSNKHTLHELPDASAQLCWWQRCGEGQEMAWRVCTNCVAKSCAKVELNGKKKSAAGFLVGSSTQCNWLYTADWGTRLQCGRSDEFING
jgi:hypothetical protein